MAEISFDEFVRREQQDLKEAEREHVDWPEQKAEWLRRLEELHDLIRGFLKPYVEAGQIKIAYTTVELNEDHIGAYSAKVMNIEIGRKLISLEPVGTLLIGSKGRVDVVGPRGMRVQLLLLNSKLTSISQIFKFSVSVDGKPPKPPLPERPKHIDWVWRIVSRPPQRSIVEITKESFLGLLVEISNG
jgi:hypothetical protein